MTSPCESSCNAPHAPPRELAKGGQIGSGEQKQPRGRRSPWPLTAAGAHGGARPGPSIPLDCRLPLHPLVKGGEAPHRNPQGAACELICREAASGGSHSFQRQSLGQLCSLLGGSQATYWHCARLPLALLASSPSWPPFPLAGWDKHRGEPPLQVVLTHCPPGRCESSLGPSQTPPPRVKSSNPRRTQAASALPPSPGGLWGLQAVWTTCLFPVSRVTGPGQARASGMGFVVPGVLRGLLQRGRKGRGAFSTRTRLTIQ